MSLRSVNRIASAVARVPASVIYRVSHPSYAVVQRREMSKKANKDNKGGKDNKKGAAAGKGPKGEEKEEDRPCGAYFFGGCYSKEHKKRRSNDILPGAKPGSCRTVCADPPKKQECVMPKGQKQKPKDKKPKN